MQLTGALSGPTLKIFPKKISDFFSKKVFLIFREMKLSTPKIRKFLILFGLSPENFFPKNFLYFLKKRFSNFQEMEFSYIFLKIYYIQNPRTFWL